MYMWNFRTNVPILYFNTFNVGFLPHKGDVHMQLFLRDMSDNVMPCFFEILKSLPLL